MKTLTMIRQILAPKYKFTAVILIFLMSVGALLEIVAVGMLMPLVTAFAQPELFQTNRYLKIIYDFIEPTNLKQFMICAAAIMIVTYTLKNTYNFAVWYAQTWYVKKLSLNLTNRVYQNTVSRPYEYFLSVNNTDLINLISQIGNFGQAFMIPLCITASELLILFILGSAIIVIAPEIAISVFLSSLFILGGYYLLTKKILVRNGKKIHDSFSDLLLQLTLTFNAIKEIKLAKNEKYFMSQVHESQNKYVTALKSSQDISTVPRMLLETWTIIIAMGILIFLLSKGVSTANIMFMAAFFLGATFRLLPSLTRVQYNISIIKQNMYLFSLIHEKLYSCKSDAIKNEQIVDFHFSEKLELENISFAYPNGDKRKVINNFNLTINPNECIAITGVSGCGKTTLIDLICGLLTPDSGSVSVDGRDICEILYSWQKSIGYVPQDTILFNISIKENIALGIDKKHIDTARLNNAIKLAQIEDFITSLPNGIDTLLGGENIRLSGGQKQRIAIARALYRNPKILIMDEATSALDAKTESDFAEAILSLKGKITILMIAHREKMIEICDRRICL